MQARPPLGIGPRSVADHALRVQVFREPGPGVRAGRPDPFERLARALGGRDEIPRALRVHERRREREHHRRLVVAAVDPVPRLALAERARGQAEAHPRRLHHQQIVPLAQLPGDDAHQLLVAAVRVDDDELADAGARDRGTERAPVIDQRRRRYRQGTGVPDVLVRLPDALDRQHAHVERFGQALGHRREHARHDGLVGRHRQVRSVLFDRRDRQHRERGLRVERLELAAREVAPAQATAHARAPAGAPSDRSDARSSAATISTSTTKASRAKPDTIISVEAGSRPAKRALRTAMYAARCSRALT